MKEKLKFLINSFNNDRFVIFATTLPVTLKRRNGIKIAFENLETIWF